MPNKIQINQSDVNPSFDIDNFDASIIAQGVKLVHYRAMRDPTGLIDMYDGRRPDPSSPKSSNGMIYTEAGCLYGLFSGNSKELKQYTGGIVNSSIAQVTTTTKYTNGDKTFLHPMDRLFYEDKTILTVHQELMQASMTGIDTLRYRCECVQDIVDKNGEVRKDFKVIDGKIHWNRAPMDINGGLVYSVRYLYRPFWYIDSLRHDIRVATTAGKTNKMNQSAIVHREYVYHDSESGDRQVESPGSGVFE